MNDVVVTGDLIVQGTNNIGSANITNENPFTITGTATNGRLLSGTGMGTASWNLLQAQNFESADVTIDGNLTLSASDNVYQSMEGNAGNTYTVTLPNGWDGVTTIRGTMFIIAKYNSTNTVSIVNSDEVLMVTMPSSPATACRIFIRHFRNTWGYISNTGVGPP